MYNSHKKYWTVSNAPLHCGQYGIITHIGDTISWPRRGNEQYKFSSRTAWRVSSASRTTDAQLSLFSSKSQTFGLGQTNWSSTFWGIMGISGQLSACILVLWVPYPCFPSINHYFYKKLSLYIHIPNMYLGLGFEFGPQRIFEFSHCVSIVRDLHHIHPRAWTYS